MKTTRPGASSKLRNTSQSSSPEEEDNIIDRNYNLAPHYKAYESEKRKLMFALTNQ